MQWTILFASGLKSREVSVYHTANMKAGGCGGGCGWMDGWMDDRWLSYLLKRLSMLSRFSSSYLPINRGNF